MIAVMNRLSYKSELFILDFRRAADQDYILSRVAYRSELHMQFIWLAHQAVEKYLKALLIFNDRSARGVGHNLTEGFRRLSKVTDIPFAFPPSVARTLAYLDARFDRYAERPYSVTMTRLIDVDATVWHLRRFCANLRGNAEPRLRISREQKKKNIAELANPLFNSRPAALSLSGGFLEFVLRDKRSLLRPHLIWNNLYFSRRRQTSLNGPREFTK
jgi:HEPN domain-containing protein